MIGSAGANSLPASDDRSDELDGGEQEVVDEGRWIQWFCALEGNDFLIEVEEDFINDSFNHYGLKKKFKNAKYKELLDLILLPYSPSDQELQDEAFLEMNQDACDLYGLLHARFIVTPRGLAMMYQKFINGQFGTCMRVNCEKQNLLPVGISDEPRTSRVKVYCPRCNDVYLPRDQKVNIDGSYFGTSFPHIFMATFQKEFPQKEEQVKYQPKVFGFPIYKKEGSKFA